MYRILPEVYDELTEALLVRIGDGSYYSGTVECLSGDVRIGLRTTLILYRGRDERPDGCRLTITSAVPVWWECHTVYGSEELLNDFDFSEITARLTDQG